MLRGKSNQTGSELVVSSLEISDDMEASWKLQYTLHY